jgi:hypothetical protein
VKENNANMRVVITSEGTRVTTKAMSDMVNFVKSTTKGLATTVFIGQGKLY